MNTRIKEIRKKAGLTQAEFAESIGLSRIMVAQVETEKEKFSDRSIRDICRIYNVSEAWIRTGEGEPFVPQSRADHIRAFVESALEDEPDSVRQRWLFVLSNLSLDDWDILDRMAISYVEGKKKDEG